MKKHLLSFLVCMAAVPVLACGCAAGPLENSPTQSPNMAHVGSALKYDNYIYFANAFQPYGDMEEGYDAQNTAINRILVDDENQIAKDEEHSLATGQEQVLAKVAASEHTFMYGSQNFIYFASPSAQINPETHGEHFYSHNEYFRVKTDGTGLTKFYTSSNEITQQSVLKIDQEEYLVLVDGNELVQIKLGKNISAPKVLASDFTSVVFAESYNTPGDEIAYYLTDIPEGDQPVTREGNLLFDVNIITGEPSQKDADENPVALNQTQTKAITLQQVFNGELYFSYSDIAQNTIYAKTTVSNFGYDTNKIAVPTDTVKGFEVILAENNQLYYVITYASETVALQQGNLDHATQILVNQQINILFSYGDYVYYTHSNSDSAKGIHRISVQDKTPEIITDMESIKTTNLSFDGTYLYFYALNTDNTSGTYYLHRTRVDINTSAELLSVLLDEDKPQNGEEE